MTSFFQVPLQLLIVYTFDDNLSGLLRIVLNILTCLVGLVRDPNSSSTRSLIPNSSSISASNLT